MENRRSEDDGMSRWVWEAVEDKTNEARMAETEGKGTKERKSTKREEERV